MSVQQERDRDLARRAGVVTSAALERPHLTLAEYEAIEREVDQLADQASIPMLVTSQVSQALLTLRARVRG
jgi:hypothetical protein